MPYKEDQYVYVENGGGYFTGKIISYQIIGGEFFYKINLVFKREVLDYVPESLILDKNPLA